MKGRQQKRQLAIINRFLEDTVNLEFQKKTAIWLWAMPLLLSPFPLPRIKPSIGAIFVLGERRTQKGSIAHITMQLPIHILVMIRSMSRNPVIFENVIGLELTKSNLKNFIPNYLSVRNKLKKLLLIIFMVLSYRSDNVKGTLNLFYMEYISIS